jgi:putative transposase
VLRRATRGRTFSNDNPFSEAQFKTLKYGPDFPERFGSAQHSRARCGPFFDWYNHEHRHRGIALLTPHEFAATFNQGELSK